MYLVNAKVKRDNKIIRIITVLFLCFVVFCCIRIVQKNNEYHFADIVIPNVQETGAEGCELLVYDNIALPVGVYKVSLDYITGQEFNYHVTMKDGGVFANGLQTNGTVLYSGLNRTNFHMWLYENTETMQLWMSGNGAGKVAIGALHIYETNELWVMLASVAVFIYLLIVVIIWYKNYNRNSKEIIEQKTIVCVLFFIIVLASIPSLWGITIGGADATYHLQRIEGVKDGLLSGQFPVRLEPKWVHGHGYANATFYCNALLFFPAILRLLGFTVTASYNAYCIMLNVATTVISYYCFSKIYNSKKIGLLSSALYTLSIFRIYKLIITGATGEGSAFTFLPLILYGLYRAFTEDTNRAEYKTVWLPIALGYAGLFQTHVLTSEITAFLTIIICVVCMKKIFCKSVFWELFKGGMTAILLSTWYLIPFLDYYLTQDLHIKHVSGRTIQERGVYPAQLFFNFWKLGSNALMGKEGMKHSHALGVGFVLAMTILVFACMWFVGAYRNERKPQIVLGKVSCVLGGMLMLMSLNIFPWDKIQQMSKLSATLVSSLQFPNRFLGWGTVFMVSTAGCLLFYFETKKNTLALQMSMVIIVVGIATSSLYLTDYINDGLDQLTIYNEEGMGFGYISGEEYKFEGTDSNQLLYGPPTTSEGIVLQEYEKKYLNVIMTVDNTLDTQGFVELPITNYKGYKAQVIGKRDFLPLQMGTNGVISVLIPPGFTGEIRVLFVSPWYWRLAEGISYVAWLCVLLYVFKTLRIRMGKERSNVEDVCRQI